MFLLGAVTKLPVLFLYFVTAPYAGYDITMLQLLLNNGLTAEGETPAIAVLKNRTLATKWRNRFTCLAAEGDHDGIINNPVAAG